MLRAKRTCAEVAAGRAGRATEKGERGKSSYCTVQYSINLPSGGSEQGERSAVHYYSNSAMRSGTIAAAWMADKLAMYIARESFVAVGNRLFFSHLLASAKAWATTPSYAG